MQAKTFHIGDILSVTTGRLVSPRHLGGVADILSWMSGETLFDHQFPRVGDECAPVLRAQFPDLAAVVPPESFGSTKEESAAAVDLWLAQQVRVFGETREVVPLHEDEHTYIDPFTEMRKVAPHAEIIPFTVPGGES